MEDWVDLLGVLGSGGLFAAVERVVGMFWYLGCVGFLCSFLIFFYLIGSWLIWFQLIAALR